MLSLRRKILRLYIVHDIIAELTLNRTVELRVVGTHLVTLAQP